MSQSFARLGHVITTAYTTLGEDGLLKSWVDPGVELVFCGEGQLGMVDKCVGRAERVKWVVYDGEERADQVSRCHASQVGEWYFGLIRCRVQWNL
jgi:long-chain acyl-CoA synthetase